jgi:hypothetical protein
MVQTAQKNSVNIVIILQDYVKIGMKKKSSLCYTIIMENKLMGRHKFFISLLAGVYIVLLLGILFIFFR